MSQDIGIKQRLGAVFCVGLLACALLVLIAFPEAAAQNLRAEVTIDGVSRDLASELRPFSSLARKPDRFSALAPLRRAAEGDAAVITEALQSRGYYAAAVTSSVRREGNKAIVKFTAEPGSKFRIIDQRLNYIDEASAARPQTLAELGVAPAKTPDGSAIKSTEDAILRKLWEQGFLGADKERHRVLADFSQQTADIEFRIASGRQGRYRDILITGNERTLDNFIRKLRPFEWGDVAKRSELDQYKDLLADTGLFSEIDLEPQLPGDDGNMDVLLRLSERQHRTLGAGLAFATDIGPTAQTYWENRNMFRRGESLRASLEVSDPLQEAALNFRKPLASIPGYWRLNTSLRNDNTEALAAQTVRVGAAFGKLWLDRRLTTETGVRLQYSDIREGECFVEDTRVDFGPALSCADQGGVIVRRDQQFRAVSFPTSILWDSQDNPLDPQEGFLAGFVVTPFVGTVSFTRVETTFTDRVFWGRRDRGTLAGRFRLGAIYGASGSDIPATERYFAGGGGSLRGYGFQEASPIDPNTGDILGGASLAEANVELRQHVSKSIELALFVEAGGAFENNTPDFDQVLTGAGLGIRYHTPIGPIRADVAVPLERRRIVGQDTDGDGVPNGSFEDASFQIYIALGQPF